jgi:hypothetical protein
VRNPDGSTPPRLPRVPWADPGQILTRPGPQRAAVARQLRAEGLKYAEIGARLGITADGARKLALAGARP